jgi:heat shock protein HtpX
MTIAHLNQEEIRRHQRRNVTHTWLLILGAGGLMAVIAWMISGTGGVIWAGLLGILGLWSASRVSPKFVLKLYKARPLLPDDLPELRHIMRELTARADLPAVPSLYYVPSQMMNAFAVGKPEDSAIAITDGLLRRLTLRQLAGILAHEVSHIRSGDLRVMALADMLNRMTSFMSSFGLFGLIFSIPANLAAGIKMPWIGFLILMAAPTVGGLLQLALSRAREYDADLDAAGLTGDPEGLAAALQALERYQGKLWESIVLPGGRQPQPSLLRTHPRTEERVARLLALRKDTTRRIRIDRQDRPPRTTIVPNTGPPRIRWHKMGVWY